MKTVGSKVYISGVTTSTTNGNNPCGVPSNTGFPICNPNGSYTQNNTGGYDAFIAEFDANDNLQWCTYVGGTGDEVGFPHIYPTYNSSTGYTVYLTGSSSSSNGPFTTSHGASYNQSFQGGTIANADAFIVKFVNRQIEWSTWFGGNGDDVIQGISGDDNYTYFFGGTSSTSGSSNICGVPAATEFPLCDYLSTYFYQDQYQNFSNFGCNFFFSAFRNSTDEIQWSTYFAERPIPGPPSYIMGLNYSPVTQQLYFGSYTANHYYMDYPIAIRPTGNPWAQNISAGKWDAIYGRFDISSWVGVDEYKQENKIFNIYPSPADGYIGLMPLKELTMGFEIEIYNSLGQLIFRKNYDEKLGNIKIRTAEYQQGLYLAQLKFKDGKVFDQKFIIQR
ncbi:MAG: T9SS type A sorting domain-containing protein [Bacteroidota bacterium]